MEYEFEIINAFGGNYQWGLKKDGQLVAMSPSAHATEEDALSQAKKAKEGMEEVEVPSPENITAKA